MRAPVCLALACLSASPAAAGQSAPPPKDAPQAVPPDGTVIKPKGPVDPGIEAKTPPPAQFPTPVVRPAPQPAAPRG